MKLVTLLVLVFLAFTQYADGQYARLPSRLKPKESKVELSRTEDKDLIEFIRGLLGTAQLVAIKLPYCQFTDGLFKVSLHSNRITAVARTPPIITYTAFKSSIIFFIKVMPLVVSGGIGHTSLIENGPHLQPAVYRATASGISCVILYSRIRKKVTFCRCRVNKVDSLTFRPGFPETQSESNTNRTFMGAISSSSTSSSTQNYPRIKNCVKRILTKGLCGHFKTQINNRRTENSDIAVVNNVYAQEVKLPRKYAPKEKEIELSKKTQADLVSFMVGLLGSGPLLEVALPNCSFSTNVWRFLLYKNEINAVARTPAIVTPTVYEHVIVIRLKMMPLGVAGYFLQSVNAPVPQRPRILRYSSTASNISCVFVYHRERENVFFCRCRVNDVAFKLEYGPIGPRDGGRSIDTSIIQPIDITPQFKNKMENCVKTILKNGLCDYFTSEINSRKEELETLVKPAIKSPHSYLI